MTSETRRPRPCRPFRRPGAARAAAQPQLPAGHASPAPTSTSSPPRAPTSGSRCSSRCRGRGLATARSATTGTPRGGPCPTGTATRCAATRCARRGRSARGRRRLRAARRHRSGLGVGRAGAAAATRWCWSGRTPASPARPAASSGARRPGPGPAARRRRDRGAGAERDRRGTARGPRGTGAAGGARRRTTSWTSTCPPACRSPGCPAAADGAPPAGALLTARHRGGARPRRRPRRRPRHPTPTTSTRTASCGRCPTQRARGRPPTPGSPARPAW